MSVTKEQRDEMRRWCGQMGGYWSRDVLPLLDELDALEAECEQLRTALQQQIKSTASANARAKLAQDLLDFERGNVQELEEVVNGSE